MPLLKAHSHWKHNIWGHRLRVLSIKQPWLYAILNMDKSVENRSYPYTKLGARDGEWISLHASSSLSKQEYESAIDMVPAWSSHWPAYSPKDRNNYFGLGCIHGFAKLKRCVTASKSEWFCGEYGWEFSAIIRLFQPYGPIKGALGLWTLPIAAKTALLDSIRHEQYDVIRP